MAVRMHILACACEDTLGDDALGDAAFGEDAFGESTSSAMRACDHAGSERVAAQRALSGSAGAPPQPSPALKDLAALKLSTFASAAVARAVAAAAIDRTCFRVAHGTATPRLVFATSSRQTRCSWARARSSAFRANTASWRHVVYSAASRRRWASRTAASRRRCSSRSFRASSSSRRCRSILNSSSLRCASSARRSARSRQPPMFVRHSLSFGEAGSGASTSGSPPLAPPSPAGQGAMASTHPGGNINSRGAAVAAPLPRSAAFGASR
mmetsp:Transcript_19069/g.53679  ORF Transcript_19069/g.53679 Transcript_19069/m.53679 type:complete len:268 (-) Transcript_19069:23-826(-)